MGEVITILKELLQMSDTSAIIKVAFIVIAVLYAIFLGARKKKSDRELARTQEQKDNSTNNSVLVKENKKLNQQVQSDSDRADDFLTRRKK